MAKRGWPIDPVWSILLPGRPWVLQERLVAWCVRMSEGGYLEDALEMHEAQHRILVEFCPGGRFQGYRKLLSHLPSAGLNHWQPVLSAFVVALDLRHAEHIATLLHGQHPYFQ